MAESPAHRFGQEIGKLLEELIQPVLRKFCEERGLFLDRHGERIGVRRGQKVSWEDKYGNTHDLDFVIEKDASPIKRGRPVAFIEAAWRRYTKHSRAKAQEIQGAVLPIAEKYDEEQPFLGAILAGIFTKGSRDQLESLNFNVVYIPYESVVAAFHVAGIDVRFDETTPDADFRRCVDRIEALQASARSKIRTALYESNKPSFDEFFTLLRRKLDRVIRRITVLPLYGTAVSFSSPAEAIGFIDGFSQNDGGGEFQRYEIRVVYSNEDTVQGIFQDKSRAIEFVNRLT